MKTILETILPAVAVAALVATWLGPQTSATAQPFYGPPVLRPYGPSGFAPYRFRPYGFYGPYPFRPFGFGGYRPRLSYGTGYHGRVTRTGGPVGGLPSRN